METAPLQVLPPEQHAVVIGGSVAGLLAARVLADHYAYVTVVERDRLPATPALRKGAPQARHTHFMLVRGWLMFESLLPTLATDLLRAGAVPVEQAADVRWLGATGWYPRYHSHLVTLSCSRPLLEWVLRDLVLRNPRVRLLEQSSVCGLLPDGAGVAGVRLHRYAPPAPHGEEEALRAALVVDASGRTSRTPQWLAELGYPAPQESAIYPMVGYATRHYTRASGAPVPDWKTLLVQNRPPHATRAAALVRVEDDRWFLTMSSVGGDYPPTREAGFDAFARSLPTAAVADFLDASTPQSPIYSYRIPRSRMRHYERMARWPSGLMVLGDAACTFNPIYGQGMTVCAESVLLLADVLREQQHARDRACRFQQRLARVLALPWKMAVAEDARYPTTRGAHPDPLMRLAQWYADGVIRHAAGSASAYQVLLEVLHLRRSPVVLARPDLLRGALAAHLAALAEPPHLRL